MTYGLRGITYYEIKVSGPERDLHSGVFGGAVFEPMTELVLLSECGTTSWQKTTERQIRYAVSKLVSPEGDILIPGVKDLIAPVTDDERQKFEAIHFQMKVGQSRRSSQWSKSDHTTLGHA